MKVKQYSKEQLEAKIQQLKSFQGTRLERRADKKYIRAYQNQLKSLN